MTEETTPVPLTFKEQWEQKKLLKRAKKKAKHNLQSQGLGRLLIETITSRLKAQGCEKINLLITGANQKVVPFYQANGFGFDDIIYMTKWITDDV
jgi:GNAT superfamily N-acetyltransferase